MSMIKYVTF